MRHAPSRTRRSAAGAACASLSTCGRACARDGEYKPNGPTDGLTETIKELNAEERVRRASVRNGIVALCGAACAALRAHAPRAAQDYFASLDKNGDKFLSVNEHLARAWPTDDCARQCPCRALRSLTRTSRECRAAA